MSGLEIIASKDHRFSDRLQDSGRYLQVHVFRCDTKEDGRERSQREQTEGRKGKEWVILP